MIPLKGAQALRRQLAAAGSALGVEIGGEVWYDRDIKEGCDVRTEWTQGTAFWKG